MKASLSEIFEALRGITHAGVPLVKKGVDTKNGSIVSLAYKSIDLKLDCHAAFLVKSDKGLVAIQNIISFFESSISVLENNPNLVLKSIKGLKGGKLSDVTAHIKDILEREKSEVNHRPSVIIKDGKLMEDFCALYLPRADKKKRTKRAKSSNLDLDIESSGDISDGAETNTGSQFPNPPMRD